MGVPHRGRNATRDESRVQKNFAAALKKAQIGRFRVYDLRHTFAPLLLVQGAPITYVAAQLGHSKPTTTLQSYAHWIASGQKRFVDGLAGPKASKPTHRATKRGHQLGTKSKSSAPDDSEAPEMIGGPSRTRTLDPLIKRPNHQLTQNHPDALNPQQLELWPRGE